MKTIDFYLDFVSPYAYLAFHALPEALQGLSHQVVYRPVLLGALFKHHGQVAPPEIPAKRAHIYRHVLWLAQQQGVPLQLPAQHPFSPLGPLRLALACSADGCINRYVAETVFAHVWQGGADAADAQRLAELAQRLQPQREPTGDAVKQDLRANTDAALALGAFGVPTFAVDGRCFWGLDALPMVRAAVAGDPGLDAIDAQVAACRRPDARAT
ncbi:MAG: 2-hydroxychromene-2-carboxylate isomerase [Rhodoferax sp.]